MRYKILFLTSQSISAVVFLSPHLRALQDHFDLRVLANTKDVGILKSRGLDIPIEYVSVERAIKPWADLKALYCLYWQFKLCKPFAVHTLTPKAGLLGMLAAWLARVPVRVHTFTGQVWVTRKGAMRFLLKLADKCTASLATDVLVDSPSQRSFLIEQGVVRGEHSAVLGAGSICGVDTKRFCPSDSVRHVVRDELGVSTNTLVCLYLGRLNPDKGVLDLARAFAKVATSNRDIELWVVGPEESNCFEQMQGLLGDAICQVRRVGYTSEPERFMQAADLFCLPSYREGFGSSVIEAAACGVPALASRIYGLTDAVKEGQTGWMHEAGNVHDLTQQLNALMANPADLAVKGKAALEYAQTVFAEDTVTAAMLHFYKKRLNETTL